MLRATFVAHNTELSRAAKRRRLGRIVRAHPVAVLNDSNESECEPDGRARRHKQHRRSAEPREPDTRQCKGQAPHPKKPHAGERCEDEVTPTNDEEHGREEPGGVAQADDIGERQAENEPERTCPGKLTKRIALAVRSRRSKQTTQEQANWKNEHARDQQYPDSTLRRME